MKNYNYKTKTSVVQNMILRFYDGLYPLKYTFEGYLLGYDDDTYVLLTHYLYRLVMTNKYNWASLPSDLSSINFVIRHLRYMLTNLSPVDIQSYALDNLFYLNESGESGT